MFSGIVESLVTLKKKVKEGTNIHFTFECDVAHELSVDQSIAHNGVCLTVTEVHADSYTVTAVEETLNLTNLGSLNLGDKVNFERCIRLNDRLDGHIVQGHVDGTAEIIDITDRDGSWEFIFQLSDQFTNIDGHAPEKLIIQKGSITINGTSLTLTHVEKQRFGVAIIPFTYTHTNFHTLCLGHKVNIELDVLGKYVAKLTSKER